MGAFKNLALHNYRTAENNLVKKELLAAKIPYVMLPRYMTTEVKTSYIGLLNGFLFTRAWNYWICTGDIPLEHAVTIHNTMESLGVIPVGEYGAKENNITGYCPILMQKEEALLADMTTQGQATKDVIVALEKLHESADPDWPRFVKEHHIDTVEGLFAFAAYIRENKIYACNGEPAGYAASVYPHLETEEA